MTRETEGFRPIPLVCPRDKNAFSVVTDSSLTCPVGHKYPIVRGIPVFLIAEASETHGVCGTSQRRALEQNDLGEDYWRPSANDPVHPAVQRMVSAAGGSLYKDLVGNLRDYPIPEIRLPAANGERLLDIGCNWGRWTIAAARKGYRVTGMDPDLGAVLAARRVAAQLGVNAEFVVADARYLPFPENSYDKVFSYSVLQHFSKTNVEMALREIAYVLAKNGEALIQMPNRLGLRSGYQQLRRIGKSRGIFHVRYWTPWELKRTFTTLIGPSKLFVDGYLGLGIQPGDRAFIPRHLHPILTVSEVLRRASLHCGPLALVADSLYLSARNKASGGSEAKK
jgi:2-polyprenyl-3-methyl-5-hydroxy-6-metoxy-1,4-benzoquinol methylase